MYRKPKYGSESCVGTFTRTGTSSYVYTFTDPDMVHTNSSSSYDLYYYDVRAYYSPDGTTQTMILKQCMPKWADQ